MSGDVIKSFLVGLGFGVDDASLAKFNKAITSATIKVTALYGATQLMAAGILKSISSISDGFEQMGYEYKLLAPAINKALILRQEMLKAYSAAGINIYKVIQASVKLNLSLTKTRYAFEAVYRSVASRFFDLITKQSDIFRNRIYANMPKIQHILESFVKFIFKALEATTTLGARLWSILTRVYDFFVLLDKATDGWSTIILGVIAAWKLLNLSFLATPLGLLIAGFTTLLALWDDFKTFKEGGQSLINWGSEMTKVIVGLTGAALAAAGVYGIWTAATAALNVVTAILSSELSVAALAAFSLEAPFWAIAGVIGAIVAALTLADEKWKIFGGHLSDFFSGIGGKILNFLGGSPAAMASQVSNTVSQLGAGLSQFALPGLNNVAANLQAGPSGVPSVNPIGSTSQNSLTNQNLHQQTNINVMGSADANAVGKAVSGEQNKVNFDMVRNMKGATR